MRGVEALGPLPSGDREADPARAVVPPSLPSGLIKRPRLERLLEAGSKRRLTTVVADAGFGKSTILAQWARGRPVAWLSVSVADRDPAVLAAGIVDAIRLLAPGIAPLVPEVFEAGRGPQARAEEARRAEALAGVVCDALDKALARDLVLVIDDLEKLEAPAAGAKLIAALCRQAPSRLHVMLASRADPPFPTERLRVTGQVLSLTGADLAFSSAETADFLKRLLGGDPGSMAERLQQSTAGWPAAVRLAADALTHAQADARPSMLERLFRAPDPILDYLLAEVIEGCPPEVRRLIETTAPFGRFSIGMCQAIGLPDAANAVESLVRRGLVLDVGGDRSWFSLSPMVRQYEHDHVRQPAGELDLARKQALAWALAAGADLDALAIAVEIGEPEAIHELLAKRGEALLAGGHVDEIIQAASTLPDRSRSPEIDRLEGEARQVQGDWDTALTLFRRLMTGEDRMAPGVAWRMGLIHHLRGELDEAIAVYERGALDGPAIDDGTRPMDRLDPVATLDTPDPRERREVSDRALLRAWWAAALWLRGDAESVRRLATEGFREATYAGDERALAVTHTVLAMLAALDGDRRANDVHYLRALDHAARGRDVLTQIRIRANRGSRFIEEGDYVAALDELGQAIKLAELTGFAAFHALALSNQGQALARLGRLDEARVDLEQARSIFQGLDSRLVAYPIGHLADVYLERGDRAMARAHYEEAIEIADAAGDVQGLVPALAGLARVLAHEEPDRAEALAERAVSIGPALGRGTALLAKAWVALQHGDIATARVATAEAASLARSRRDRAALAESLELQAAFADDPGAAAGRLSEARTIWRDLRCVLAEARVEIALSAVRRSGSPGASARADAAVALLVSAGAEVPTVSSVTDGEALEAASSIELRTLGGFELVREGRVVATAEWGSRRARDLVKILVARSGRRVPREQLMELLWPEEDPVLGARRLSVMISTARAVLDPDRRQVPIGGIGADREAVWLAVPSSAIDVERFLEGARLGLSLVSSDPTAARRQLETAGAAYRGDFLEDDPYVDWAVPLREESRAAYLEIGHTLARMAAQAGDAEAAIRHLRRVLEREPYDEAGHLGLVEQLLSAGQPAQARRAYQSYVGRMAELGVEAAAFPFVPRHPNGDRGRTNT